jgi:hypothetical protein
MTDYAAMDNQTLRRMIAEKLGYLQVHTTSLDGIPIVYIQDVWGKHINSDWPESVDAAKRLFEPLPENHQLTMKFHWKSRTWIVGLERYEDNTTASKPIDCYGLAIAEDNELARAICLAFLAWSDSKEKAK